MGRKSAPWFRKHDGWWCTTIRGDVKKLAKGEKNKKAAEKRFHQLMAAPPEVESNSISLVALCEEHAETVKSQVAPDTWDNYHRFISSFTKFTDKSIAADSIQPRHLEAWFKVHPKWGPSTRRLATSVIGSLLSWGVEQGHLKTNPLKGAKRPPPKSRDQAMSRDVFKRILEGISASGQELKDFLEFMGETGCRPSEAMRIEGAWIDFDTGVAEFHGKTTRKTGRNRKIYLTPRAIEICRKLAVLHPEGPIFRNSTGKPWTRHKLADRFLFLRRKLNLPDGTCPETIRHGWITDALVEGVPIATVAELAGHTDTNMVGRVYSKLHTRTDHLKSELAKIRPSKPQ